MAGLDPAIHAVPFRNRLDAFYLRYGIGERAEFRRGDLVGESAGGHKGWHADCQPDETTALIATAIGRYLVTHNISRARYHVSTSVWPEEGE